MCWHLFLWAKWTLTVPYSQWSNWMKEITLTDFIVCMKLFTHQRKGFFAQSWGSLTSSNKHQEHGKWQLLWVDTYNKGYSIWHPGMEGNVSRSLFTRFYLFRRPPPHILFGDNPPDIFYFCRKPFRTHFYCTPQDLKWNSPNEEIKRQVLLPLQSFMLF